MRGNIISIIVFVINYFFAGHLAHGQTNPTQNILPDSLTHSTQEFSGMCIYNNELFLLPQSAKGTYIGNIHSLSLNDVKKRIDSNIAITNYKTYRLVNFEFVRRRAIKKDTKEFEGFEAISIVNKTIFLTIETGVDTCFIIKGYFKDSLIELDTTNIFPIAKIRKNGKPVFNAGYESMAIHRNKLLLAFEYNYFGKNKSGVDSAKFYLIDTSLKNTRVEQLPLKKLALRITDLAPSGPDKFLGINYFFHGDSTYRLSGEENKDRELDKLDWNNKCYTRILEFAITKNRVEYKTKRVITDTDCDNWEGIVPFRNGVLIINDMFSATKPNISKLVYYPFTH